MKLSELTFEMALKPGERDFTMHEDASDCQRSIRSQEELDIVRQDVIKKYGDMDITVNLDAPWYDVITYNDELWQSDHRAYCARKQAFCDKYGCE